MTYDVNAVRVVLDQVKSEGRSALTAPEAKAVCDSFAIPLPKEGLATSAEGAVTMAEEMGYPLVMKIVSPDILHKTEAGGVKVGVSSADEVRRNYDEILGNAKAYKADADITGVQVLDANVAAHLIRTVAAAKMLGGEVVITGISPEAAQTLVTLNVDLSAIRTRGTLQAGVREAFRLVGSQVTTT